jgi:hypothetical protein
VSLGAHLPRVQQRMRAQLNELRRRNQPKTGDCDPANRDPRQPISATHLPRHQPPNQQRRLLILVHPPAVMAQHDPETANYPIPAANYPQSSNPPSPNSRYPRCPIVFNPPCPIPIPISISHAPNPPISQLIQPVAQRMLAVSGFGFAFGFGAVVWDRDAPDPGASQSG